MRKRSCANDFRTATAVMVCGRYTLIGQQGSYVLEQGEAAHAGIGLHLLSHLGDVNRKLMTASRTAQRSSAELSIGDSHASPSGLFQ